VDLTLAKRASALVVGEQKKVRNTPKHATNDMLRNCIPRSLCKKDIHIGNKAIL
jgi:hypothetical protein